MKNKIKKLRKKLYNRIPLFGNSIRRKAVQSVGIPGDKSELEFLIEAADANDSGTVDIAAGLLGSLESKDLTDSLCEHYLRNGSKVIAEVIKKADYRHSAVGPRCMIYVLLHQFEEYIALDFEFQNLKPEYQAADEKLKERIRNAIQKSGDSRLLGLFRAARRTKLAADLTGQEASILIDVHKRNRQWEEILKLLFFLSPDMLLKAIMVLKASGWKPAGEQENELLKEATAIAESVPEKTVHPVDKKYFIGKTFYAWLEKGSSKEWQAKPETELLNLLEKGTPPEAVTAFAALSGKRKLTDAEIERVNNHPHWMVRLAGVAMIPQQPELYFENYKPSVSGAELWVEPLGTGLMEPTGLRAVRFTPDSLTKLQNIMTKLQQNRSEKLPLAKLLESLAKYNLRHAVEIDAKMTVSIDETAIEIEG